MKLVHVCALFVAASLLAPSYSIAQGKPNNPDAPVSSEQPIQPEPPDPTPPPDDPPAPTPPPSPDDPSGPPEFISSNDTQSLMDLLTLAGMKPELGKTNVGRTKITFTFGGATTSIYYYDCHDGMGDCDSIRFVHGLDLPNGAPLAAVNRWNATESWGRAYIDDNGDPWLDLSLWVGDQMPFSIFNQVMGAWTQAASKFKLHFEGK